MRGGCASEGRKCTGKDTGGPYGCGTHLLGCPAERGSCDPGMKKKRRKKEKLVTSHK